MTPAESRIRRWKEDPVFFVNDVFGAKPDLWQHRALEAFPRNQRIAIKANKGPGKSALDAWCIWNFLATRLNPKVIVTSVSGDNLKDGLWAELAKWRAKSPFLQAAFTQTAERIWANDHPKTWFASARTWSKSADPSEQANTLAGVHGDYVLFVLDEVGSIPDAVVATAEAALATGIETKILMTGNPTQSSGPLYRAFTRERDIWFRVEVTGDPDDPMRSPRVSVDWAREQIKKYGRDNPWVLVNVFGQFPPTQSNALLGIEEVTAAAKRALLPAEYYYAPKILGVDVARFGDDASVIMPRQGKVAMQAQVFRGLNTMDMAGQVALAISSWNPDATFIDVTGVGAGVVDRLQQLGHNVTGIDFGSKALKTDPKIADRRSEMWWNMAAWVKAGGAIPDDSELVSELTGPTYHFDASGRLKLESKEDMKKRGLPSPNKGDALALTFAMPVVARGDILLDQQQRPQTVTYDYDPLAERSAPSVHLQ